MYPIFNNEQRQLADIILKNNHIMPLSKLYSSHVQNLAIEWSYYSGKIEGNTYTFVQTEMLLKDGIVSTRSYEEAKMLKNLYNTFISEVEYIKKEGHTETIDEKLIFRLHSQLADDLIENKMRGVLRMLPVRIAGTDYVPPFDVFAIEQRLSEITKEQNLYTNPLEKAVYLHCNIAKLQPFIDGNKRTSRMLESIALMNADIIPVFSVNHNDFEKYKEGLLRFYETGDYTLYSDYLLNKKIA
ncbi:MAG: Fic family protein, partial [Bacteroidota bacterium]|nr:Fic family protein [Bacteroidota bacterium]